MSRDLGPDPREWAEHLTGRWADAERASHAEDVRSWEEEVLGVGTQTPGWMTVPTMFDPPEGPYQPQLGEEWSPHACRYCGYDPCRCQLGGGWP
jgi:hypothetical protein